MVSCRAGSSRLTLASQPVFTAALTLVVLVAALLLPGCRQEPSLVGRWRDQSPASLLYEFREDGSVWLVQGDRSLPVFRYGVTDEGVLELHDGMGRRRALCYELVADRLLLRELADPDVIFAEYWRAPSHLATAHTLPLRLRSSPQELAAWGLAHLESDSHSPVTPSLAQLRRKAGGDTAIWTPLRLWLLLGRVPRWQYSHPGRRSA